MAALTAAGILLVVAGLVTLLMRRTAAAARAENEVAHAGVDRAKTVEGAEVLGTVLSDSDYLDELDELSERNE